MFSSPRWKTSLAKVLGILVVSGTAVSTAFADEGTPVAWGLGLQAPASPVGRHIDDFHNVLLWIITIISVFVLGLLLYVIARYNKYVNKKSSKTTHNVKLEVVWTLVPCLILIGIALISFPLLYYSDRIPPPDLTLKVTGHQWYWSYEYPDNGGISFDSHAIWDSSDVTEDQAAKLIKDAESGWLVQDKPLRMLEVDNRVVLPVGKVVRVQIAAGDVEHSWFLPSMGINRMAVPGHLTELWLKVDHEGVYYGQCSMICGRGHGYMPIVIEGVAPEKFAAWAAKKKSTSLNGANSNQFAAAEPAAAK